MFTTKGIPLGIEFAGGTAVIVAVRSADHACSRCAPRSTSRFPGGGQNVIVQTFGDPSPAPGDDPRAARRRRAGHVAQPDQAAGRSTRSRKGNLGTFHEAGHRDRRPGGRPGADAARRCSATVLSLVGILAYLAFRFQFSFGVGAVVATIHDLLITLAFLAFFRYDMSLNVIAAILTMTGYLDQRHDRHLRPDPREPARRCAATRCIDVINASINQTLGRTVITVGHGAADRARAVLLRRRGAARLRVHDDRRHHHRHLLERLHRRGDRQLLARQRADARRARTRRRDARRRRRSSRSASRSRSARRRAS